ncbi:MAG: lysylphosphatidylglycerol synthase domain-containing protein [Fibrobacterota bacterium]
MKMLSRKKVILIIKAVITLLIIVVLNRSVLTGMNELTENLAALPLTRWSLISAGILSAIMQGVKIIRWQETLSYFGVRADFTASARSYFLGALFALITPGRIGEIFRGTSLTKSSGVTVGSAVIFEKAITISITFVAALLFFQFLPGGYDAFFRGSELKILSFYVLFMHIAAVTVLLLIFFFPLVLAPRIRRFRRKGWLYSRILLSTVVIHLILLGQTGYLLHEAGLFSFTEGFRIASQTYSAIQFTPVTVANMGVREYFLGFFGTCFAPQGGGAFSTGILTVSLIILFCNIILPALPGAVIFYSRKFYDKETG